ncbi:hypothetical protein ABE178_15765 [Priestia megaterium]
MNSANLEWFVLSQGIYNIGTFVIMSALFQLRVRRHFNKIAVVSLLNSIINYLVYFNTDAKIGYVVPIISVLITFLYLTAVVKIPTIWSLMVTVSGGLILPLVVQLGIIFSSFGFFMPAELKQHIWRNYALDITSGLVYSLIAVLLYLKGWGFTFDFEKIRFKWERNLVIGISICASLCLPSTIIFTHISAITPSLTFLSISSFFVFVFLLAYALKKEHDEIQFLKPIEEVNKHD